MWVWFLCQNLLVTDKAGEQAYTVVTLHTGGWLLGEYPSWPSVHVSVVAPYSSCRFPVVCRRCSLLAQT